MKSGAMAEKQLEERNLLSVNAQQFHYSVFLSDLQFHMVGDAW